MSIAVALLLSISTYHISPNTAGYFSFLGILFPYILFAYVLCTLAWFFFSSAKIGLLFLGIVCVFYKHGLNTFGYHFFKSEKEVENSIKVMSWNVKSFDLYNWSNNKATAKKMKQIILNEKPDILCLQEFHNSASYCNLEDIRSENKFKYVYFHPYVSLQKSDQWGIAIFSKYKLIDTNFIQFTNNQSSNGCIYATVKIDSVHSFQLFTTHLQSIHFGYEDYNYIEEVKQTIDSTDWKSTFSIISKLKTANQKRADQVHWINERITDKSKTLICGDFNDVPVSYSYAQLKKGMRDVFTEKGKGFSETFASFIPTIRIDYFLIGDKIEAHSYKRIKKKLSDHYPIITTITIKE